jgi:Skp family chaperone for outer membrane proteins
MFSAEVKRTALAGLAMLASYSAIAASGGVAVVDMAAVIDGSKYTEAALKSKKKLEDTYQELVLQHQTLAKEQSDLEKSKAVTSTATYNKKQAALEEKQKVLAKKDHELQETALKEQEKHMKFMRKLHEVVKSASAKVAAKKGFDLVLSTEVLFSNGQNDITKEVTAEVEKSKLF